MKIDSKIQSIIVDIQSGKLNEYLKQIDNSDFGLYIPAFEDQGTIKSMMEGYSQKEQNLAISIEKNDGSSLESGFTVGWIGKPKSEELVCDHVHDPDDPRPHRPNRDFCDHAHDPDNTRPRYGNRNQNISQTNSDIDSAPELDYHAVVKQIDDKQEFLDALAAYGMGLTLLHGHSDQFMFTKLPEGYVSVIASGVTTFRKESDVAQDKTFVPNSWRSINAEIRVAGGHSQFVIN